jgi:site-specific DNA-adenine methylase
MEKKGPRISFLRYPGGKQRLMRYILPLIRIGMEPTDRYIEPFVGGAAVFFLLILKELFYLT